MTDIREKTFEENSTEKGEIRILLVGTTGSGKSTLGNVLINRNDNFQEVFEEGHDIWSKTNDFNSANVEIEGINYIIIDTPGFEGTSFEATDIPLNFVEFDNYTQSGINHVFFVINLRFTRTNLKLFKYLKEVFFEEDIVKYITIICTHFKFFGDGNRCIENTKYLRKKSESIAEIIGDVNIIYVNNNLPLDKKYSRETILDHLKSFRNEKRCKPRSGNLRERIEKWNEADLVRMKKHLNETDGYIKKIRSFIEWRKNMEEEINNDMANLIFYVKNCEVLAVCGNFISLVGESLMVENLTDAEYSTGNLGLVIHVTGNAIEFGFLLVEVIINHRYYRRITKKIEEDKEKRFTLLRIRFMDQLIDDHEDSTKIIRELSIKNSLPEIKTVFERLCALIDESSKSNETSKINVTDQESNKVKYILSTIINIEKESLFNKFRNDDKLLEIEQTDLQEEYENTENEVGKLEAKLKKENLAFL